MLSQTSQAFRKLFLLSFTQELIKNYVQKDFSEDAFFKLKTILKQKKENKVEKENKEQIHKIIKEKKKELGTFEKLKQPLIKIRRPILRFPEPQLPPTVQYLKPTPSNVQIDLGKLNPLIKDPLVRLIECEGPEKNIKVQGTMGIKPTRIILSADEIDDIIHKFSDASKIPVIEGFFKVAVGNLTFSAIVSYVVGSKFIIKKIPQTNYKY